MKVEAFSEMREVIISGGSVLFGNLYTDDLDDLYTTNTVSQICGPMLVLFFYSASNLLGHFEGGVIVSSIELCR